jgi:multisubunit Na+/H+ antiporter MnhG subunit
MDKEQTPMGPVSKATVRGSTIGLPAALIGLLVAFNVPLSQTQQMAILVFVAAAGPAVSTAAAWWAARRGTAQAARRRNLRPDRF